MLFWIRQQRWWYICWLPLESCVVWTQNLFSAPCMGDIFCDSDWFSENTYNLSKILHTQRNFLLTIESNNERFQRWEISILFYVWRSQTYERIQCVTDQFKESIPTWLLRVTMKPPSLVTSRHSTETYKSFTHTWCKPFKYRSYNVAMLGCLENCSTAQQLKIIQKNHQYICIGATDCQFTKWICPANIHYMQDYACITFFCP